MPNIPVDVTPSHPLDQQPTIGLIGMGAMGTMYARHLADAGWKKYVPCFPSLSLAKPTFPSLKNLRVPGITVHADGHAVSRISDFIMYSVEAEFIGRVVSQYGPSTKVGAIVAGQTSVKAPEKAAFESHLPNDVHIVSLHSLHGPTVSPVGQPLVIIKHRAPDESVRIVENIFKCFKSRYVYLTYEDHDLVTANVQAVTHAAFLTMGTAWAAQRAYPWEQGQYVGGIETVKVNIMLRIYANKWHVYAGLAILNPSAKIQIDTYASSATELFKLMLAGDHDGLRQRIYAARESVFGVKDTEQGSSTPIFLTEDVLDQFTIGGSTKRPGYSPTGHSAPKNNSHLALLAMFRMWIGVAEYLCRSVSRLDAAINAAVYDVTHRSDDLEFVVAARGWSQCVAFGDFELYKDRFMQTATFFESRFEEANKIGGAMIKAIVDSNTPVIT
ncbi:hypothetical protein JVT61DRAFT_3981 [Boletus reticuloceps]|uniref:Prephenate/arogenate dehydrogenase domain-containing protein n=1 Tax=Boletus reticuloceps TaxID=495285 RepID=A0A8I2YL14_9AGAM|nr:hypothetical protein JVT61DRAFT_3981 [Boletus reticuloceps]